MTNHVPHLTPIERNTLHSSGFRHRMSLLASGNESASETETSPK